MRKTARASIAIAAAAVPLLLSATASADAQTGLTQSGNGFSVVSGKVNRILTDELGVPVFPKENNPAVLSLKVARGVVPHNGVFEDEVGDPDSLFCLQPDDRTLKRVRVGELLAAIAAQKVCSEVGQCDSRKDQSVPQMRATIQDSCAASPSLLKGVDILSGRVGQQVDDYIRQVRSQDAARKKDAERSAAREKAQLDAKRQAEAAAAAPTADGWPQLPPVAGLLRAGWSCEKIQGFAVVLVGYRDSGVSLTDVIRPIESGAFSAQERAPAEQLAGQVYRRYRRTVGSFQDAIRQTCNANR